MKPLWMVPTVFASQFMLINPAYADASPMFSNVPPGFEQLAPTLPPGSVDVIQLFIDFNKNCILNVQELTQIFFSDISVEA